MAKFAYREHAHDVAPKTATDYSGETDSNANAQIRSSFQMLDAP